MKVPENRLKRALASGETTLGLWSQLCSPAAAEILAQTSVDWVLFDAEHAPADVSTIVGLLQAGQCGQASLAVRPPWNDRIWIKRLLDGGAQSLVVPYVQSAVEALDAVQSCRYPPKGLRGVAGLTRASAHGRIPDYLQTAHEQLCLIVQVETAEALGELDAIAAVDGIDGVFIGPADLSASMDHLANPSHPEVQSAIEDAAKRIDAAGKAPGILASDPADIRRYRDWGYRFIACGIDVHLLAAGADRLLEALS